MKSKLWKLGIAVLCIGVASPVALRWTVEMGIEGMFANDEVSTRQTVLPMLDGGISLGLYRQHMWDALLWTVIATRDPLPRTIAARNAELDSAIQQLVVASDAQLNFQEPPRRLEQQSRPDATLCGKDRCQTIRCDEATRACVVVH
jgi:hypothetical protein